MAAEAILTGACNGAVFNKSAASTNCSHVEARRLLIKQPHGDLEYFSKEPADPSLQWQDHFTSLLLSADYFNTSLELTFLAVVTACAFLFPPDLVNVDGSMSMREFAAFLWATSAMRRFYTAYLEAVYFTFPSSRIQPVNEHRLKKRADLCGR